MSEYLKQQLNKIFIMISKSKIKQFFYTNNAFMKAIPKGIYISVSFNYSVVILISNSFADTVKHSFYLQKQMFLY